MRIIIDAMGGDTAPDAIVRGALDAMAEFGVDVTLVGQAERVKACLRENRAAENERLSVVNATEIVTMEDDPSTATRHKKDSSMTVALNLLRDGQGDAVISAGSTGALLTGATLIVKRVRGIRRAALAPVLPNGGKGVMPGMSFQITGHTNELVRLWAKGAYSEMFWRYADQYDVNFSFYSGHNADGAYIDNTDIFRVMEAAINGE